jgi:hypothetical protein
VIADALDRLKSTTRNPFTDSPDVFAPAVVDFIIGRAFEVAEAPRLQGTISMPKGLMLHTSKVGALGSVPWEGLRLTAPDTTVPIGEWHLAGPLTILCPKDKSRELDEAHVATVTARMDRTPSGEAVATFARVQVLTPERDMLPPTAAADNSTSTYNTIAHSHESMKKC